MVSPDVAEKGLRGKQEQTKFDDLRRGIAKDFLKIGKVSKDFVKKNKKKFLILSDLRFCVIL